MIVVRTIAWVVGIVYATVPSYWLIVHRRARRWAEAGGRSLFRVGPVWPLMWILLALLTWKVRSRALYESPWMCLPGGLLILVGVFVYLGAWRSFTFDQLLGLSELAPQQYEQRLVVAGIRARIRHPFYLGHLCELLGWAVAGGLLVCYLLLLFAVVTGYAAIRAEERELEQRFGESYRDYRRHSAAMFPGVW